MRAKLAVAAIVVIALVAGGWFWWGRHAEESTVASGDGGNLTLVEAAGRAFEGAPALALTFPLPLDAKKNYDSFIQVFEMPPRPADAAPKKEREDGDEEDADNDD